MKVHVVIPTTRPSVDDLIRSLGQGSRVPDGIIVVSNEVVPKLPHVGLVRFDSPSQPYGKGDAGLRRNIGADLSDADVLIFIDDDCIAPRSLVETAVDIVEKDGFCWGHHRFIDFEAIWPGDLIDKDPEEGRSREHGVNRWHGWQSSYAGNLAIRRDLFWEVGGFDLAYLGHHGSEDQQFGRRLGKAHGYQTFVHEPPFAWHPEVDVFHSERKTNIMGNHRMVRQTVNGHEFATCESCPCRRPVDVPALTMSDEVVIPYSRSDFTLEKETS